MPETTTTNEDAGRTWPHQIASDPRLRAGRLRIRRHAFLRGAVIGIWITLPISALLWKITPGNPHGLFHSISLMLGGALLSGLYQRFRVRALWPRIWDATLESAALVETVLHCRRDPNADSWGESLQARSAQLPLPSRAALHRLAPLPSPLVSLSLTLVAILLGTLQGPLPEPAADRSDRIMTDSGSPSEQVEVSPVALNTENTAQWLRSREDAALALAGRRQLAGLSGHLRLGSAPPKPPVPLSERDREALEIALSRLQQQDPRRQLLQNWIETDPGSEANRSIPIDGLDATGTPIARGATPGTRSGSLSGELASGGSDTPDLLEPVSAAGAGVEQIENPIRIDPGSSRENETTANGRSPSRRETSSSWDRVRDDPRLEARWIEVIDLYLNLLRGREQNGGR